MNVAAEMPRRKTPSRLRFDHEDRSYFVLPALSLKHAVTKQMILMGTCKRKARLQPIHSVKAPPNGAPTGTATVMTIDMYERNFVAVLGGTMSR